jgi:LacI family transcriptional regulator
MPGQDESRITIRQVATEAGVSVATISAVITGNRRVSEATRRKVMDAIGRTGYRPNRLAQSLSTQRTKTVGVLMPTILSPVSPALFRAATDVLHANGYSALFANTEMHASLENEATELMFDSQVAGLLLVPAKGTAPALDLFRRAGKPVVLMLHGLKGTDAYDVVGSGNFKGSFDAVTHLVGQGCRRIAILALPSDTDSEEQRLAGYKTALLAAGLPVDPQLMRTGEPSESGSSDEQGFVLTQQLMALPEPPDAIFAMNQYMAIGSLAALKASGRRVPDDVALVGYDDLVWTRHLEPALSTVAQQVETIGRMAAARLVERLESDGYQDPPEAITVDTQFILRASSDRSRTILDEGEITE